MTLAKKIVSEALNLKPAERFIVIEALIQSLDIPDPKIEEAWVEEAEKRLKSYKAGKLEVVSFGDMFKNKLK